MSASNFRKSVDSREFFNFYIFCPNNLYSTLISKITFSLVAGTTDTKIAQVKQSMAERFDFKDMGVLNYFLGMQVIQKSGKAWIGQPTYAEKVLSKFGMDNP